MDTCFDLNHAIKIVSFKKGCIGKYLRNIYAHTPKAASSDDSGFHARIAYQWRLAIAEQVLAVDIDFKEDNELRRESMRVLSRKLGITVVTVIAIAGTTVALPGVADAMGGHWGGGHWGGHGGH